jgi:hypothetical protein
MAAQARQGDVGRIECRTRRYIGKTDDRPWCNPATWLNQERWADQPAQSHKSANNLFAEAIV